MRKGLMFLFVFISFLGINTVSAKEIYFEYDTNINQIQSYINEIGYDKINNSINELINYYNENLSDNYPYYIISLTTNDDTYDTYDDKLHIIITAFDDKGYVDYPLRYFDQTFDTSYILVDYTYSGGTVQYKYNYEINEISLLDINDGYNFLSFFDIDSNISRLYPYHYYYSNFDLYYRGDILPTSDESGTAGFLTYLKYDDILYFPYLDDSSIYYDHKANEKFIIEPYYLYDNNESFIANFYTTINLNDYPYVILSLKDYTPRDTFTTNMYVKGQLCPTTLYNYGLEEKKDYISGWQSPDCGIYQENYKLYLNYVRSEDISNHAIYYLTAYDKSKPNLVKVDSSIYNITYITSENKDKPYVSINGKDYSVLPYDTLSDTSKLTHENGTNNTWTCAKYDTDCFLDSSGIDIDNLFKNPLETLKSVWGAITSIFSLITSFILLLPPTMQAFLYLAFGVSIALGIIKILL